MTVSPDHYISWQDQPFFREKGVLDPGLSDLKKMGEATGLCKISEDFTLFRRKDVFSRCKVIRDQNDTIPMEDLFGSHLLKGLDGKGCSDIVAESQIDPGIDEIARANLFFLGMEGQYLFCNRHRMSFGH
jgi:hypothetical protein